MKLIPVVVLFLAVSACSASPRQEVAQAASDEPMLPQPTGKTLVFECGDYEFLARTGPGELAVWLHDRYLVLGQVRAASGAKYEGDGVVVWLKGNEALLEDHGSRWTGCLQAPRRVPWEDARRRGVNFRAVGNEPGWHVEIVDGQRLLYVGAYGAERKLLPAPEREELEKSVVYRVQEGGDSVVVEAGEVPCTDSMSGDSFPVTVDLTVDGRHLRGCGMILEQHWE